MTIEGLPRVLRMEETAAKRVQVVNCDDCNRTHIGFCGEGIICSCGQIKLAKMRYVTFADDPRKFDHDYNELEFRNAEAWLNEGGLIGNSFDKMVKYWLSTQPFYKQWLHHLRNFWCKIKFQIWKYSTNTSKK